MLVEIQVLRFPEGVHGSVEFAPPPQVHGGGPMLVAGDLDARPARCFERGRVGATLIAASIWRSIDAIWAWRTDRAKCPPVSETGFGL